MFRDLGAEILNRGGLAVSLDTTYRAHPQLVSGITIWGVACLDDLIEVLHGRPVLGAGPPCSAASG